MIHIKRLLISFGLAWAASVLGLIVMSSFQERVENYYSADPFGDSLKVLLLFGFYSLMCVGAAWILVAIPYYFVFLRECKKWSLILYSLLAGIVGFLFMVFATHFLPVDGRSWRFTAPIAFVVGLLGAFMMRYDLFLPKSRQSEPQR